MKDLSPINITAAAVGFPARICIITRKDGGVFRFAESDEAIVVDGDSYAVVPGLHISAVKHTGNGEMASCQIIAVHSDLSVFETSVVDAGLFEAAQVQLYTVDRMNLSRKGLLFTGAIGNTTYNLENQVIFEVKGLGQFSNVLITQKRSPMCRTDLGSDLCQVDLSLYAVATTVAAIINPFSFTVTGALAQPNRWFNQGVAVTSAGLGIEIANWSQTSQNISTYLPLASQMLTIGDNLTLYPGCDKTITTENGCKKYNNQANFQGEPHFLGTAAAAQQV